MEGVPASRGYSDGFSAALMLKDLRLAATAAQTCAAPLHMGRTAEQLYKQVTAFALQRAPTLCKLHHAHAEAPNGAVCRSIKTLTLEQCLETSMLQASNSATSQANPPSCSALRSQPTSCQRTK